ncbi:hypothetical protein [[Eubacterium] cellulosolvens]
MWCLSFSYEANFIPKGIRSLARAHEALKSDREEIMKSYDQGIGKIKK